VDGAAGERQQLMAALSTNGKYAAIRVRALIGILAFIPR
jgi:hypothetical protein